MKYYVMCPMCPASFRAVANSLAKALKAGKAEEPNHTKDGCQGEVWIGLGEADDLEHGAPAMWRPDGTIMTRKGIELEPLTVAIPDGSHFRIRFPVPDPDAEFGEIIIEHGRPIGLN